MRLRRRSRMRMRKHRDRGQIHRVADCCTCSRMALWTQTSFFVRVFYVDGFASVCPRTVLSANLGGRALTLETQD